MVIDKKWLAEKWPVILACAILVTIPFFKLNNNLIQLFTAMALYTGWKERPGMDKKDWIIFLPSVLFLTYLTGLIWSYDFMEGWKKVEKLLPFAALPLAFYLLRNKFKKEDLLFILYFSIFLCVIASVICYGHAIANILKYHSFRVLEAKERDYYYYSYLYLVEPVDIDPIYLSLFVNFSIVILLLRPLKSRFWHGALLLYLIVFEFLIASKIGILTLLGFGLVYLLQRIRNKYWAVACAAFLVVSFGVTVKTSTFLSSRFLIASTYEYGDEYSGNWNSISQRLAIWSCAAEAATRIFPFGYGTANGQHRLEDVYRERGYTRGFVDNYNPHSEYLATLLDTGLPGLVVIVLMIILPLVRAHKTHHQMLFYFQLFIAISFFIEVVFARRHGIVYYAFFYPMLFIFGSLFRETLKKPVA